MKKIMIIGITIIILLVTCTPEKFEANSWSISLPVDDEATIVGFTQKRSVQVTYNDGRTIDGVGISSSQIVGYAHIYAGRYRANEKIDGKYYDALLINVAMEPCAFKNLKGTTLYGFSKCAELECTLHDYHTYRGNSPTNDTSGGTEYTVGIQAGYGATAEGSVSGQVKINSKYCKVVDSSLVSQRLFNVSYNYKDSVLDFVNGSARNTVLFSQTWHLATCEWTTLVQSYAEVLKVNAEFGISRAKNAGLGNPVGFTVEKPAQFTLKYSNSMS